MNRMNHMSRRTFLRMGSLIGASTLLSACNGSSNGGSQDGGNADDAGATSFKIGHIGPLTGGAAIYGNATNNGAQIAIDEINAESGAIQFAFNSQDDEHDAEKSVNAYNNLKDWGMQILVGTTTTTPCVAVSAETNADRIFQLTPSASSVNVLGGEEIGASGPRKDNVFQMCFTDPNQGTASAQYISEQKLGTKIAVIYNNADAYSTGIYNTFMEKAAELNLEVVSETTFTDDTATDFSVQVAAAKDSGADLLFLPIYYQPASLILAEASKQAYAPSFFGVDGMDGILTMEGFDASLAEGVMLLTPFVANADDPKTQSFVSTYRDLYGDVPNQFAADAYDCIYAIKAALEAAGCTPDQSAEEICEALIASITTITFDGITGTGVTWAPTGEVSKSPKGMVIKDGAYVAM